jgi:hypothetical protein
LVWSALGGASSTGDDSPVPASARFAHIPAAIRSRNPAPEIVVPWANWAMLNRAATVVSSLITISPPIEGPTIVISTTLLLTCAVA